MVKELRQILQRFVSKSTLLTSKPALEINGESQQFEQIARAALLPRCFRTGELSLGALDPDFPIDAMRPERQMLTGRTLDRVGVPDSKWTKNNVKPVRNRAVSAGEGLCDGIPLRR